MPTASILLMSICDLSKSVLHNLVISSIIASIGRVFKVGTLSFAIIFPVLSTIPAAMLVPPKSIPI